MKDIEQEFRKVFERNIDYRNKDIKEIKFDSNVMFDIIKNKVQISILTGINGIGKTYWLKRFRDKIDGEKIILLELKKYNSLTKIKDELKKFYKKGIILLDGLDELNLDIKNETIDYIFSLQDQRIIVSSRKDFLIKNNMFDVKNNIYEILPISDTIVNKIVSEEKIDISKLRGAKKLLNTPRFLEYIIEIKTQLKEVNGIDKYKILDIFVKKHLDVMNVRTATRIEENIHKKILQSLALAMMMGGRNNITLEEFITFLSRINYLDVKSYILNEKIIETFLSNQVLVNDGINIQFESKELLEFLAAKEIIECNIGNYELYQMMVNSQKEIGSTWFNVISYLVDGSLIYRKLILNSIFDNLQEKDGMLDLLIAIDLNETDQNMIIKNIINIVKQYSYLYQYIDYNNNFFMSITSMLGEKILYELVKELERYDFLSELKEEQIICINNILNLIADITSTYQIKKQELISFLEKHEFLIENVKFKVRFFEIYLKVMTPKKIDAVIVERKIDLRLLDEMFYYCKCLEKLKNIDIIINKYILEKISNKFSKNNIYVIDDDRIIKFIGRYYNVKRANMLIESIDSIEKMVSFLKFFKDWDFKAFNKKTIALKLYEFIIAPLIFNEELKKNDFRENLIFERDGSLAFRNIIYICIAQKVIEKEILIHCDTSDYILEYIYEIIIECLLINDIEISEIYDVLSENEKIILYNVWKFNLSSEEKYTNFIKEKFLKEYNVFEKQMTKIDTKNQKNIQIELEKIYNAKNIFFVIRHMEQMLNDSEKYIEVFSNEVNKKIFKQIIKRIEDYIQNVNEEEAEITYSADNQNYNIDLNVHFYSMAINVLNMAKNNINKYNSKSIILLSNRYRISNIKYTKKDYEKLITYLEYRASEGYIKYYLNEIIEHLKYRYRTDLVSFIKKWIEEYEFDEYQINILFSEIKDNLEKIEPKVLEKFKQYKSCQDLLIMLNVESEIINRVNHIKENLVYEGDYWELEQNGNFEYSSKSYTEALTKIDIKYVGYIKELIDFAFTKYNNKDCYYFVKYILELVSDFLKNNIEKNEINSLIEFVLKKEKDAKNRFFYKTCKSISEYNKSEIKEFGLVIAELNQYMIQNINKIYSSEELFGIVTKMIENDIFADIKNIDFIEIFRNEKNKINYLKESIYQFFIGYELSRMLMLEGFKTKVVYETTSPNKKRGDIQLITEGFVNDIIIETKLTNNKDLSPAQIERYVNDTLSKYKLNFNSPKILFVIINQELKSQTAKAKVEKVREHNNGFLYPVLIDLKELFDKKNENT